MFQSIKVSQLQLTLPYLHVAARWNQIRTKLVLLCIQTSVNIVFIMSIKLMFSFFSEHQFISVLLRAPWTRGLRLRLDLARPVSMEKTRANRIFLLCDVIM